MLFRRLLAAETRKMLKAPVFWVAPLVLFLYLLLMLFGYEVYAAKNGVDVEPGVQTASSQYSGSAIVYMYSTLRRMAGNILTLSQEAQRVLGGKYEEYELVIDEPNTPVLKKDFDFFDTLLRGLANPKPLPSSPCDCPCKEQTTPVAEPSVLTPAESWLFLFSFIGTAYADDLVPPPPSLVEESFIERLNKRLHWLTAPVSLEKKIIDRSRFNGLRFAYLSLYFAFIFIFPPLAVAIASQVFAVEIGRGTIKTCLLMPVNRWRLMFAKLLVITGYLFFAILAFVVSTLLVGCVFAGYGNLVIDSELLGIAGGDRMIIGDGAILLFIIAVPLATVSLLPLVSIAALFSVIKPESTYVIGVSVIGYFIFYALGQMPLFEDIRFLFFTSYMDLWSLIFEQPVDNARLVMDTTVAFLLSGGLLLAVQRRFSRLDIEV